MDLNCAEHREEIEAGFPNLRKTAYEVTSWPAPYNCIAWAAEDTRRPWWPNARPDYYWPDGCPEAETVEAFIETFKTLGYEPCSDGSFEDGFLKVAIFEDDLEVRHM